LEELVSGGDGGAGGVAAGDDVEVAGFELQDHGAGLAGLFGGGAPDSLGEGVDHGGGFFQKDILGVGVFGGDGFGGAVGDDLAVIDATGKAVEAAATFAEVGFEFKGAF